MRRKIMTYTEDFKCILAKQDNVVNANLFILRNSNPKKIKVFPEEVSSVLLENTLKHYQLQQMKASLWTLFQIQSKKYFASY